MNWVNIGSGTGLSPTPCQAITWTNDGLLSIRPWNFNQKLYTFIQENAIENVCQIGGHFVQGEMS